MLKNVVLTQKQEKEKLLSLPYVIRNKAIEGKKWLASDLIKVILGPRRAGKSVFALMLLADRPFAYFNFDDESMPAPTPYGAGPAVGGEFNYDELIQELRAAYGATKYILFDEIQNLPKWELFVNRLHREGYNLVLTGSNANLLSRELSTALTGRHIPIEILPFDFREFLRAKQYSSVPGQSLLAEQKGRLLQLWEQYLIIGGYPEVAVKDLDPKDYLAVLFDALLFKDVLKRHKVRFSEHIDNLSSYLINNAANHYSLRKLTNLLGFRSGVTLEKYIGYLIEAYMLFSLQRYTPKTGERLKSPKKAYAVDNGFIAAKAIQHSPDTGRLLENCVFIELVKGGLSPNRDLFYYKTRNDREIDFAVKKGTRITELIQVAAELTNPAVEQREIRALVEAGQELSVDKLTVITRNEKREIIKDGQKIKLIPAWERFICQ